MSLDKDKVAKFFDPKKSITQLAKEYCEAEGVEYSDYVRRRFSKIIHQFNLIVDSNSDTKDYKNRKKEEDSPKIFSAKLDGKLLNIEEYCTHYNLDLSSVRSYKLVTHSGTPFYNIVFYEQEELTTVSLDELKTIIKDGLDLSRSRKNIVSTKGKRGVGVVKIADLHLGAYVNQIIRTKEFSISILIDKLEKAADIINNMGFSKVHVHILGDLIESFTGLNHRNTWKGLDKGLAGAEAVKLVVRVLDENFLSKIENLDLVKVVAGNHDRVTSDNKEDVQGEAANLVCWGLSLLEYSVEFNPLVLTHTVGGICHILTHGHHPISQKPTKQLCWDYGKQNMFNLICEGHLHSIIENLSTVQRSKFNTIKDDAVDHRRITCPSFFTGNFFSEALGYTSQSGFVIVEDNGEGIPNVYYYAL